MRLPFLRCVVVFALAHAVPLFADDPVRWNAVTECQMVVLPQKAALALLPELQDDAKIDAAFAKLQTMIAAGEAQLAANLVAKSIAGQKSTAESVEEMKYATEYDPPIFPDKIPKENPIEFLKAWPVNGPTPRGFAERKFGATMESQPSAAEDGRWIDVAITLEHSRFLRWNKFDSGILSTGKAVSFEQPHFHSLKNIASIRLRNGQRILVGVHKLAPPETAFELFLLRVVARKAE